MFYQQKTLIPQVKFSPYIIDMGIQRDTNRFFGNIGKGFRRFGKQVVRGVNTATDFVEQKALPTIEKVSKQIVGRVIKSAPIIRAVAPQLLPLAIGAGAIAKVVGSGAKSGRKLIGVGRDIVAGAKKDNNEEMLSGIERAKDIMKINKPPPKVMARV